MQVRWQWKKFQKISAKELHQIYMLRASVFCEEHGKAFKDPDEKDRDAWHLLCFKEVPEPKYTEPTLVAYARIPFRKVNNKKVIIERVVIHKDYRNPELAIAKQLMQYINDMLDSRYKNQSAYLSIPADKFSEGLPKLYEQFGFKFEKRRNPKIVGPEETSGNISTINQQMKREPLNRAQQSKPKAMTEEKSSAVKLATFGLMGVTAAVAVGLRLFSKSPAKTVEAAIITPKPGPGGW